MELFDYDSRWRRFAVRTVFGLVIVCLLVRLCWSQWRRLQGRPPQPHWARVLFRLQTVGTRVIAAPPKKGPAPSWGRAALTGPTSPSPQISPTQVPRSSFARSTLRLPVPSTRSTRSTLIASKKFFTFVSRQIKNNQSNKNFNQFIFILDFLAWRKMKWGNGGGGRVSHDCEPGQLALIQWTGDWSRRCKS
jgi:hypothetical protein